ncbi:MAG: pantoate--beta-alanine ligase [Acidimicrobiia bacterium]|nr:pantoate--beta-alanine ligase [Acidimicrobiia bacterium]MBT8217513.1 pantoate--beta-alanine ligase [Acidimicrobiia bacterium]NNF09035.1 pantoate--beta-alanine ligase [Acidimicrobiia bacterium]NNL70058.1 pantoate--beta-alanine ligase [Acidimicrobiia bacterium]
MGYLHEGHLSLMSAAAAECDTVVASIFVNPLQFGEPDDLNRYPRDVERDAGLAAGAGVDVLFTPEIDEMYPQLPPMTSIRVDGLTEQLEGRHRPGHFDGVAVVVAKLFAGIQPDRAFFGRKDAQQLAVVQRMAADLSFPVDIVPVSTVREHDGLALSSRNRFLSTSEREAAAALSAGLFAAADAVEAGERDGATLESIVRRAAAERGRLTLEYASLADAATVQPVSTLSADSFLAVAVRVGETRLIDNVAFSVVGDNVIVDRGVRLDGPSVLEGG